MGGESDVIIDLPYSGKLSKEKTFRGFRGFGAISESFLRENQWPHPLIISGS